MMVLYDGASLQSLSDREFRHKHYADWQRANMAVVTAMSNAETTIVYKVGSYTSAGDRTRVLRSGSIGVVKRG